MAQNIKCQDNAKIKTSPYFAIQLDETTDVVNLSQLIVFVRYVDDQEFTDEFLFS